MAPGWPVRRAAAARAASQSDDLFFTLVARVFARLTSPPGVTR